jgi:hypothetical protein
MNLDQAKQVLGNRAEYELRHMVKALQSLGGFFNTDEDNQRLKAAKIVLRDISKRKSKPN